MKYNIAPKPTFYDSIRFRSRLEATWAAFFDLVKWRWEYEPLDLKGWIPDFVLHGVEPIAVEVKPVFSFEDFPQEGFDKMNASGWIGRILIVGTTVGSVKSGIPSLGWLADNRLPVEGSRVDWKQCRLVNYDHGEQIDIATDPNQRGFIHDGEKVTAHQSEVVMRRLWNLASNKTAWRR